MSVLLQRCVTCSDAYGILIVFLSELFNDSFMHHAMSWVIVFVVAADVGVFIIITFLDVPISALFYPFLFYIQVEKIINHTHTHFTRIHDSIVLNLFL